MTCRELVELVTAYFDDALPAEQRREFEVHISACDGCTAYVEQMRATIAAVGRLDQESIPPEVRDTLLDAFKSWNGGEQPLP